MKFENNSLKFLIIDDEYLIRKALALSIESFGHSVQMASNGKEGLKIWEAFSPHFVFLDVLMPDSNGFTVLKSKPKNSKAKIILMSAHDELSEKKLREAEVDLFIKKPFDNIFHLIEKVKRLMNKECESSVVL